METQKEPVTKEKLVEWLKNDLRAAITCIDIIANDPVIIDLVAERLLEMQEKAILFENQN